jgi:hypothetical protein
LDFVVGSPGGTAALSVQAAVLSQSNPSLADRFWLVAGRQTTVVGSGSKAVVGGFWYNPADYRPQAKSWTLSVVMDAADATQPAVVDLYDLGGIFAFPPAQVAGSQLSTGSLTPARLTASLTSQFSAVTGSGFIELRLWMSPSGSAANYFVGVREAYLDVRYT